MPLTTSHYAGFEHQSTEIRKFLQTYGTFTLMLRNGAIIHYQPEHALDFQRWLNHHQIEDIRMSLKQNEAFNVQQ
jgi:hypothetical protein